MSYYVDYFLKMLAHACCILSIHFLKSWEYAEMDDGHNVWGWFFIL